MLTIIKRLVYSPKIPSINQLMSDRTLFDKTIYTPLANALVELSERRIQLQLRKKIESFLNNDIPLPLKDAPRAVLFRQVATPNYEIRRFFSIIELVEGLEPLFWEYHSDKFTSNNEWKHSLGKLFFYKGKGKKGGAIIDALKIIDFNSSNGKPINEVTTLWGQRLIDFHHDLFKETFIDNSENYFDAADWFSTHGKSAAKYYESFLALFVQHAVLFENFMLDEKEADFTREIFLPAFLKVWKITGKKPLIVSLEPTDIEGDQFWVCHPHEYMDLVMQKIPLNQDV